MGVGGSILLFFSMHLICVTRQCGYSASQIMYRACGFYLQCMVFSVNTAGCSRLGILYNKTTAACNTIPSSLPPKLLYYTAALFRCADGQNQRNQKQTLEQRWQDWSGIRYLILNLTDHQNSQGHLALPSAENGKK